MPNLCVRHSTLATWEKSGMKVTFFTVCGRNPCMHTIPSPTSKNECGTPIKAQGTIAKWWEVGISPGPHFIYANP